jgi:hypothetical protein
VKVRVDFRYSDIGYELWALERLVGLSERMIAMASDSEEERIWADLKARGWDDDQAEQQFASQDVDDLRTVAIPRQTRGATVVALWAGYEGAALDVAEWLAKALGRTEEFERRDRRDFLRTTPEFFDRELGLALDEDLARLDRLRDVLDVRNAIAHTGGRLGRLNRTLRTRVIRIRGLTFDEAHDVVVPTADFLTAAYADVNASLISLVERAKAREDDLPSALGGLSAD